MDIINGIMLRSSDLITTERGSAGSAKVGNKISQPYSLLHNVPEICLFIQYILRFSPADLLIGIMGRHSNLQLRVLARTSNNVQYIIQVTSTTYNVFKIRAERDNES